MLSSKIVRRPYPKNIFIDRANYSDKNALYTLKNSDQKKDSEKEPQLKNKPFYVIQQAWSIFLNGPTTDEKTEIEKNADNLKMKFDAMQVQQLFYEDILDGSQSNRFEYLSHSGENIIRFDKNPASKNAFWEEQDRKSPDHKTIQGGLKTQLLKNGQLVPVSPLPMEIFFENSPTKMANLVYQHVMGLNKNNFSVKTEKDASLEQIEAIRAIESEKLDKINNAGSPMTSGTKNPPMQGNLAKWGATGEHIAICTSQLKVLPPTMLAYLIKFHANHDGINQPSTKKWRENKECFASVDCDSVKIMEKKLKEVGIDPDGSWTKREAAIFYVLVADEHMIAGTTPEGSAKIIETEKFLSDSV